MNDSELRLECLKLARASVDDEHVLVRAQEYFEFIKNGTLPKSAELGK